MVGRLHYWASPIVLGQASTEQALADERRRFPMRVLTAPDTITPEQWARAEASGPLLSPRECKVEIIEPSADSTRRSPAP
jgi:hypothetical protein